MGRKKFAIGALILVLIVSLFVLLIQQLNIPTKIPDQPISNNYDSKEEVAKGIERLSTVNKAGVVEGVTTTQPIVSLTFEGLQDQDTMKRLMTLLKEYDISATFFVPGIKAAEDTKAVNAISSNHTIGNYTLNAEKDFTSKSSEEMVSDLINTNGILKKITSKEPRLLKINSTDITDNLLLSSAASSLDSVVKSSKYLSYQSLKTEEDAQGFVNGLENGSIVSIKLEGVLDGAEYGQISERDSNREPSLVGDDEETKTLDIVGVTQLFLEALKTKNINVVSVAELNQHITLPIETVTTPNQPSVVTPVKPTNPTVPTQELVDTTPKDYASLRTTNKGKKASSVSYIYTTDTMVSYTFRDISNESVVLGILDTLDTINAKATFFVTGKEIETNPSLVKKIVQRGHQLGNGGLGSSRISPSQLTYDEISYDIDMGERWLRTILGTNYDSVLNKTYMPLYGDGEGYVSEAASSLGYKTLTMYNRSAIRKNYDGLSSQEIMNAYFKNIISLHRGDVVHFRLNFLSDANVVESLIKDIANQYIFPAKYTISPVTVLSTSQNVYVPLSKNESKKSGIVNTLNGTDEFLFKRIVEHYIGNPDMASSSVLQGFSDEEMSQINTEGRINTNGEKVIFLTFDDWGSDVAINKLLDVLDKHNALSTFFVRTGSASFSIGDDFTNPNLLRAIALKGHDIGNHTFKHIPVNIHTNDEKQIIQDDIVFAQQELFRYLYDTDTLKLYFRPPTLAASRLGLETVFDMGFEYIINGDFSTHDYEAKDLQSLVDKLKYGISPTRKIGPGSVVVMHMSDESQFTAEALDEVIPYYQSMGYRFAPLSEYLVNDYANDPISNND